MKTKLITLVNWSNSALVNGVLSQLTFGTSLLSNTQLIKVVLGVLFIDLVFIFYQIFLKLENLGLILCLFYTNF